MEIWFGDFQQRCKRDYQCVTLMQASTLVTHVEDQSNELIMMSEILWHVGRGKKRKQLIVDGLRFGQ